MSICGSATCKAVWPHGAWPRLAVQHELDVRIHQLQRLSPLPRFLRVRVRLVLQHLPRPPHLATQRLVLDIVRLRAAIRAAQVRETRVPRAVAVLDPIQRLVERVSAKIEAKAGRRVGVLAPAQKLVCPKLVRFVPLPGEPGPRLALLARTDRIFPVVWGAEVAAWVADHGDLEDLEGVNDILAEAVGVGESVAGVGDAAVDAAADVFWASFS